MATRFEFIEKVNVRTHEAGETFGKLLVDAFHLIALFAIGATIVWAAVFSFLGMVEQGSASIQDTVVVVLCYIIMVLLLILSRALIKLRSSKQLTNGLYQW